MNEAYCNAQIKARYEELREQKRRSDADPDNLRKGQVINLGGVVNYVVGERMGKEIPIHPILKDGSLGSPHTLDWGTRFKKVSK